MPANFRGLTSLAQGAATSITLTVPSQAIVGDLLLATLVIAGGTGVTITPPSSAWQLVSRTNDGTNQAQATYQKRYATGDPATFVWTFTSGACVGALHAWGGADVSLPIDVSGGQANAASSSVTAPSVTTTRSNDRMVWIGSSHTGAVTYTPPGSFVERLDTAGAAISLSIADANQETLGASGTRVGTASASVANVGTLIALSPSALNTPARVRDEGNWVLSGWNSRITTETQMDAFVEKLIQRANDYLRARVGPPWYGDNASLSDPWDDLLTEAEMHLAQAFLLEAAAGVSETGLDTNPAPFLGTAENILQVAQRRRENAERIILATKWGGSAARPLLSSDGTAT
jgi:hypothetical protein